MAWAWISLEVLALIVTIYTTKLSSANTGKTIKIEHESLTRERRSPNINHGRMGGRYGGYNFGQHRPGQNGQNGNDDKAMKITVSPCEEEGLTLVQGSSNYYLKCQKIPNSEGYFHVVYICPKEMTSLSDMAACVPPPDCFQCHGHGQHGGRHSSGASEGMTPMHSPTSTHMLPQNLGEINHGQQYRNNRGTLPVDNTGGWNQGLGQSQYNPFLHNGQYGYSGSGINQQNNGRNRAFGHMDQNGNMRNGMGFNGNVTS